MPILAEVIDAVVGVDFHRDTHTVEIVLPIAATFATFSVSTDTTGYAAPAGWILDHAPGPGSPVSKAPAATASGSLALRHRRPAGARVRAAPPHRSTRRGRVRPDRRPSRRLTVFCLHATLLPIPARTGYGRGCGSCSEHAAT